MKFKYDCANCPDKKLEELNYIINNQEDINYDDFKISRIKNYLVAFINHS